MTPLDPTPDPAAARAEFLRRLAASGFLPAPAVVAAFNAVTGSTLPDGRTAGEADPDDRAPLRDDVDGFAAAYWSLSPTERLARWAGLMTRCGPVEDAIAARLWQLETGLEVEVKTDPNPVIAAVAALIRELYLLPPRPRAVRRNRWLADRGDLHELAEPARDLAATDEALAALEPTLVARLCGGRAVPPPVTPGEPPPDNFSTIRSTSAPATAAAGAGPGGRMGLALGVFVVLQCLRLMVGQTSGNAGPAAVPAPPPVATWPSFGPDPAAAETSPPARVWENRAIPHTGAAPPTRPPASLGIFTPTQVRDYLVYEADLLNREMPARYEDWLAAGRPGGRPAFALPPKAGGGP